MNDSLKQKPKSFRYKVLTWVVVFVQLTSLLSVGAFTTLQPTPEQASQVALDAGLGSWVADAAANVVAFGQSLFGTQQTALAESGSFFVTASGSTFSCGLTSNSGVMCWGQNNKGQLGNNTNTNNLVPVQVTGLTSGVIDLAAGDDFACALTSAGGVKCWGGNDVGQLGNRDVLNKASQNSPVDVYQLQGGVVAIDGGANHMCALMKTGGVKCWGGNTYGQIGDGATGNDWWPVDVLGLQSGVAAISAGLYHSCAVLTDGTAKCWGYDGQGELGALGGNSPAPVNVVVDTSGTPLQGIMAISAGYFHTCAVLTTGGVKCWGYNASGELGNGTTTSASYPVDVPTLSGGVAAISAGNQYTCALLANGGVKCWGYNANGQLGDGTTTNRTTPVGAGGLTSGVAGVSTSISGYHSCAALTAGGVRCWGYNASGQLGNNSTTTSTSPVNVGGAFTGYQATVPLIRLVPAGGFDFGARNLNTTSAAKTATVYNPSAVALTISSISMTGTDANQFAISGGTCGATFPLSLAAGSTCTVQVTFTPTSLGGKSAGLTVASNANNAASITAPLAGVGASIGSGAPTITSNGGLATANVNVFENGSFVTAVTSQGASPISFSIFGGTDAALFNIDQSGNLRFNSAPNFEAPVDADHNNIYDVIVAVQNNIDTAIQELFVKVQDAPDTFSYVVAVGTGFSCAVASGGSVKCWGLNTKGQVGDGTTANKSIPTQVTGVTGAIAVAAGDDFACAVTSSGSVQCWGANDVGQLGNGTTNTTANSTPVQVPNLTGVIAIDAGANHVCVLTSSGGAKCWGGNTYGQLGVSGTGNSSSPADVAGLTSGVAAISAGLYHSCAVLTDGTAKCWGYDGQGELGALGGNSTTPVNVVVDANGVAVTGLRTISAGYFHTCAVLTTGGVKCWGYNASGELGNGTTTSASYPVDVPALSGAVDPGGVGVAAISAGNQYTCAALNDGSAKCWGYNANGQLGDGTATNRTVPVPVTGLASSVVAISTSVSGYHTCAVTNDGNVKCLGYNANGQLGYGSTTAANYYPVMAGDANNPITAPTTPTISLSPAGGSLAFGSQSVNTTSSPQTVTINNTGASPLTLNSASLTGSNYAISGGTCGTSFPVLVNAGANCTVQITFTPISAGLKASTLTISSNSGGQPTSTTFSLSGTGVTGTPTPDLTATANANATATANAAASATANAAATATAAANANATATSIAATATANAPTPTATATPGNVATATAAANATATANANATATSIAATATANAPTPTATATVNPGAPNLSLSITNPAALTVGVPTSYGATISNAPGAGTATSATFQIKLPANVKYGSVTQPSNGSVSCTSDNNVAGGEILICTETFTSPGLTTGGICTFSVNVTPQANSSGTTASTKGVIDPSGGSTVPTGAGNCTALNTPAVGCTAPTSGLSVNPSGVLPGSIKAILGGAYDVSTGWMRDDLRAANLIPTTSPYSSAPATANASVFAVTGANAIVDWVLVELHDATTPTTVVVRKSAFVQRDGDVVDVDGVTNLSFSGLSASTYYVAIKHRNHLGVMTGSPVTVISNMVAADFTTTSLTYGTNAQRFYNNVYLMWPGDGNGDTKIIMSGPNNDTNGILSTVLLDPGNTGQNSNYIVRGYKNGDVNLDGKVLASGPSNDRNFVASTVLLYPANTSSNANYIINQQAP